MKAYVLIKIAVGNIHPALKLLRRMECIHDATMTMGPFDIVAVLESPDLGQISRCVALDIQTIPGVVETCTCLTVLPGENRTTGSPQSLQAV